MEILGMFGHRAWNIAKVDDIQFFKKVLTLV